MKTFVFCLAAILVSTAKAEDQYTLDSVQTYFDLCAQNGKPIELPPLILTANSRQGHIGSLVNHNKNIIVKYRVFQQIREGTLVMIDRFTIPYNTATNGRRGVEYVTAGGTTQSYGPFLFKHQDLAGLQSGAVFMPQNLWQVTSPFTYETSVGTNTIATVEPVPDGTIQIPEKMPHRFLYKHEARDWRMLDEGLLTRGVYIGYRSGTVWIMDKDSEIIKHSLFQLSKEDQAFIRKEIKENRREHLIPDLELEWKEAADRQQK
jgi:hypothetical protein